MNEKRFALLLPNAIINDTIVRKSYYLSEKEDVEKLVGMLNEQDKEIGLLRLELDTHRHPLWSTREAERKVNKLSDSLANEVKKNGLLNEKINQLRIENMRLKRKLQICSAHLLSDECCLTDGQIRKIIKEMTNE